MNKLSRNLLVTAIALGTSLVSVSSMAAVKRW